MKEVLFVCRGNICRSPMAAALFNDLLQRQRQSAATHASSAGIWATEGQAASIEAQKVMRERGLDISGHRAHNLTAHDLMTADLIVSMEEGIAEAMRIESGEAANKIYTLGDLADDPMDVPDPYGMPVDEYRYVADLLRGLLQHAYMRIIALLA